MCAYTLSQEEGPLIVDDQYISTQSTTGSRPDDDDVGLAVGLSFIVLIVLVILVVAIIISLIYYWWASVSIVTIVTVDGYIPWDIKLFFLFEEVYN